MMALGKITAGWMLFVFAWLTVTAPLTAQVPDSSGLAQGWDGVVALRVGSDVEVQSISGTTSRGRLALAGATELTLISSRGRETLQREEIRQVVHIGRKTSRFAKRGLVVGAIAGAVLGTALTRSNRTQWTLMLAGGWGAIGAAIGAADGANRLERTTAYQPDGSNEHR